MSDASHPGPASEDPTTIEDLRREAVVRAAGGLAAAGAGLHLLVAGLGGVVGLNPLGLLYLPVGLVGVVVSAGLLVEAAIRVVRIGRSRGAIAERRPPGSQRRRARRQEERRAHQARRGDD